MRRAKQRTLSFVLAFLTVATAVLGPLGFTVRAAETTTWEKVNLEDITESDTVLITMSKDGATWVLPSTQKGDKGGPLAATLDGVSGDTLTLEDISDYGWNIQKAADDSGYTIQSNGEYLYSKDTNNGVKVGNPEDNSNIWNIDSTSGYLCVKLSESTTRYLGVYNSQDWRCYTSINNNIKNQTLNFWRQQSGQGESTDPVVPPAENTCATVQVSVPAGPVTAGTQVQLECATPEATIYYNTDGTENYLTYDGNPITIDTDTAIKTYASKTDLADSEVVTYNYTIAAEVVADPAIAPVSGEVAEGTTVIITNNAEGAVLYYTIDGSDPISSNTRAEYKEDTVLTVSGAMKVMAVAEKEGVFSNVVSADYTLPAADGEEGEDGGEEIPPSYEVDPNFAGAVAQWGGGINNTLGEYTKTVVYGDRFATNDGLDQDSKFTVVLDGSEAAAYTDPTNTNASTNHYMGASKFGADDYLQFETSSHGFANMEMSFRMRVTKASPKEYILQYSTDGVTFKNFTTGSYYAKFTSYSGGDPKEVEYSGNITGGIMKYDSNIAGQYVSFTLDVPEGASNAQKLLIRFVGGAEKVSGTGSPSGNIRVDSVMIKGNPVVSADSVGYVTAEPKAGETLLGQELTLTSGTEGATIYYAMDNGAYQEYDPAKKPVLQTLPANVSAYAKLGENTSIVTTFSYVQAQCEMVKANPNGGSVVKGTLLKLRCNTQDVTIQYAYVAEGVDELSWIDYKEPFALENLPTEIKVRATKTGYLDSEIATLKFEEKENEKYNIYFGQLHSHTNYSDGSGSVEEAFQHASQVDNLDFLAVTDHSNSFDEADNSVISQNMDTQPTNEWTNGHELAKKYSTDDFTALMGYEMTWSNGLGHMNTFNTPGYQSRTQSAYKTYSTALQNYYAALRTVPDSISMFNHPGTTFGDFSDFAYWTEANDALITMIEVGNGEGAIGSSGHFPSYEYYTRALDKGWHVSPTNNQDNHKGMWGNANTARSVVLADKNTDTQIYDAMRNNRMYATEDNNLSIYYTLDGYIMGTKLEREDVTDQVNLVVELKDADEKDAIGKVEVIVNGGLSVASKSVTTSAETVTFDVPTNYSYYYIKVTQADGDIAVTSPVWVGTVEACGINKTYTNAALAVQNEALDINVDFYNNEKANLVINSIEASVDGKVVHTSTADSLTAAGVAVVAPEGSGTYSFDYAHDGVGSVIYTITVKASLNGVEKIYTDKLELSYTVKELVTKVIIDGSHYNDYVTGYYGGRMGEFLKICADKNINAVIDTDGITAEELKDCALLVISAPAKKSGSDNEGAYQVSHFEDSFIAAVKDYVANGGSVILCGLADYQDTTDGQTATEQNKLLQAIGSTIRINSDEAYDTEINGGQAYRLYLENFDASSPWLTGVVQGQQYSSYSGSTVNVDQAGENDIVAAATALVTGFDSTYSIDCKDDKGNGVSGQPTYVDKGKTVFLASQETKAGGNIFVAGSVFMSDYEVKAEMDNVDSLPYMNYNIIVNILNSVERELELTPISEARKGNIGDLFAVEGYVTAGTDNENTTFFDSIYIQDETGGICLFPFSESGLEIGTKIRVTGSVDEYQGERELQILSYKILSTEEKKVYEPKELTTAQAVDYDTFGGQLVKVTGTVTRVQLTSDGLGIAEYWVKDDSGVEAAVFIDGYILSKTKGTNTLAEMVKVGDTVTGCGILYKHPEGDSDVSVPVLRVRDCDEIVRVSQGTSGTEGEGSGGGNGSGSGNDSGNTGSGNNNSGSGTGNGSGSGSTGSGNSSSGSSNSGSSSTGSTGSANSNLGSSTGNAGTGAAAAGNKASAGQPAAPSAEKVNSAPAATSSSTKDTTEQNSTVNEITAEESTDTSVADATEAMPSAETGIIDDGQVTEEQMVEKSKEESRQESSKKVEPAAVAAAGIAASCAVVGGGWCVYAYKAGKIGFWKKR